MSHLKYKNQSIGEFAKLQPRLLKQIQKSDATSTNHSVPPRQLINTISFHVCNLVENLHNSSVHAHKGRFQANHDTGAGVDLLCTQTCTSVYNLLLQDAAKTLDAGGQH